MGFGREVSFVLIYGGSAFEGQTFEYPHRRVTQEDNDISLPGTKRSGLPDDSLPGGSRSKRLREYKDAV